MVYSFRKIVTLMALPVLASACASGPAKISENDPALERINKRVFNTTSKVDTYFLKPVAKGYDWVVPDPLEKRVNNVFNNADEVVTAANNLLQGKVKRAAKDTGRIIVNSTIGIGGLFEVAEPLGLRKDDPEDFGQTLAVWGVGSGPYVFLPLMGPSTLRDAPAMVVDFFLHPFSYVEPARAENIIRGVDVVQSRANTLEFTTLTGDNPYYFIKDAYLQRREYLINDGEIKDDFEKNSDDIDEFGDFDADF